MPFTRRAVNRASHSALATAVVALAGCATGSTSTTQNASSSPSVPANAPALEQAYVSVVAKVLPSVVQITSDRALGSGIVFDTKGDIVTNAHVVGQATKFQVRLVSRNSTVFT
jgi:S1-C subfamily serine protease